MRYAMTGATGFLGEVIARRLVDDGHEVVALVRNPAKAAELRRLGAELVPGDLDDPAALDRLLEGADGFFHVAGWYKFGRRERAQLHRVNVDGTRNALEAARRAGVRTVYTSTLAVNSDTAGAVPDETFRFRGTHQTEYDRTKALAHDIALDFATGGLPLVIVQPSVIYGPGDTSTLGGIARKVAAGKFVAGPKGGACCWTHVEDVADGHVRAMEQGKPGESYFLAGERATYEDALTRLARISGGRKPMFAPVGAIRVLAKLNGALERVVPLPSDMTGEGMLASTATYYGDSGKAERELGWTARPLDQGLAETYARS